MDDVIATTFASTLSLEKMRDTLSMHFANMHWRMGESYYEGDYVKGATPEAVGVRILREADRYCAETYFPLTSDAEPMLSDAQKRAFMQWLEQQLLAAIHATDIAPA
jgi:hypothetical protein